MSAVRALLVAAGLAVALVAAGCGGNDAASTTPGTTTTTTTTAAKTTISVYFLRNGQVWPVARSSPFSDAAGGALAQLGPGPTAGEKADLGLGTAIPAITFYLAGTQGADRVVRYGPKRSLGRQALAQVVYTLTQFPTVKAVEINGTRYKRSDFEAHTPPILVESPLSGETVTSPIHVTGTANTFEATFQYELRGADGKIISKHFEMATSGSGTRGTFDFTVPFTVDREEPGKLVVYESSAEDGSRIHVQEIPLELSP